jgi:hypothetical protein
MRALLASAALLSILVLAAPVGAQKSSDMPTELWSAYPLVQKVERSKSTAESRSIGPLLPPSATETVPVSGDATRWGVWLAVATLGLLAALLTARTIRAVSAADATAREYRARASRAPVISWPPVREQEPMQLRPSPQTAPRVPVAEPLPQYAPQPVETPDDVEDEPRRFVMRRTGLLRSRFVVLADEPDRGPKVLASSRSFWRVGRAARREQSAEDAWDDLMNELRQSGWEQESARRSDYYVSLRRVDLATSAVLPTIEAYTHASED